MNAIRILPDRVANQIAAGEVVERPASVVKELVENALDAGATRIEVEFSHGGRSLLRVEDNGSGMSRDDALLSLERHATSKIREAADLDHVASFGFRGEALPSIASVCRFTLQTRTAAQEHGTEIFVNGGKMVHVRDCGMPAGTRIAVAQLFNSVPARRKFLKSDATESAHIIHTCRLYALASPHVAFTLREDAQVIFQSPVCENLADRMREVFGEKSAEGLMPIDAAEGDLRLRGLIGRPGVTRASRHEMIVFVNRRPVESRTLAYALLESYHTLIPKGRYPVAFVFLDLDPAGVDVNVHPAKREVRFRDEPRVRGFTIRTVLAALREASAEVKRAVASIEAAVAGSTVGSRPAAPEIAAPAPATHPSAGAGAADFARANRGAPPSPAAAPAGVARPASDRSTPPTSTARLSAVPVAPEPVPSPAPAPAIASTDWRHLGDLVGGYSLFETAGGLMVVDRRAAAERVWYERLRQQLCGGGDAAAESQRLLFPLTLELDPIAAAALNERLPLLRAHGLEVEPFGRDVYRIESVPAWLAPEEAEPFVRDVLGLIRTGRLGGRDLDHVRDEIARAAAVRAAGAAGGVLGPGALLGLIHDLLGCETPHTSPAGRPTFVEISTGELARRFHKLPLPNARAVMED